MKNRLHVTERLTVWSLVISYHWYPDASLVGSSIISFILISFALPLFIDSSLLSFACSFIFIHSLLMYTFIHSFIHSFMHSLSSYPFCRIDLIIKLIAHSPKSLCSCTGYR